MCFGEQTEVECDICDKITVQETIWLGCHVQVLDDDSYPSCARPLISKKYLTIPCLTCVFETTEDVDSDDEYPDFSDHPALPDVKPAVEVTLIDLPAPTDFKTIEALENLADPADELPRYEDVPHEISPPSWELSEIREDGRYSEVYHKAVAHWKDHLTIVSNHRKLLSKLYWRVPTEGSPVHVKLEFANEYMTSFLLDAENSIKRIGFLHKTLSELETQSEEEWFMQSPVERECLQYKRDAIVRELQDYLEQFDLLFFKTYDEDLDRRMECLGRDIADQIDVEISEKSLVESSDLRTWTLLNVDVEIFEKFLVESSDMRFCWCT